MNNLAISYFAAGRTQEALQLYEDTLQLMRARLGPGHPDTLRSMNNLAASYDAAGRTREALQLREATLQLRKAQLGPDHPDTLVSMNNLAASYTHAGRAAEALALLQDSLARRQRRREAAPGNRAEQAALAWTHGQIGEAELARHDYPAAVQAFATSVELFDPLDKPGALIDPFFRARMNDSRQRLALCRKAEQAVRDLDFALAQPAAEVPGLLNLRVQALAANRDQAGVVATAAAYAKLAEKDPTQRYNAACAWSRAAGLAQARGADAAALAEDYAGRALALLKQTPTGKGHFVATPAALAAHMKQDPDLDPLRPRADFQRLLAELAGEPPRHEAEKPAAGR
jgi:hypothetical protein